MRRNKEENRGVKRVAVVGSQGVPPKYGGFETLVANIASRRNRQQVDYTIYCSKPDMGDILREYKGCKLYHIPLRAHGVWSVAYDIVSMLHASRGHDAILVLGVSGCTFLPILRLISGAKIIVNIDGLEHERDKWGKLARKFLRLSLRSCMHWAHEIVSDNKGIQAYVQKHFNRDATLIAYGGDHALRNVNKTRQEAILEFYGLREQEYDLSISRIEPENNVHLTLEAYCGSGKRIVIIGNWNFNDYSRQLYTHYREYKEAVLLNSIYDLDILYALRNNARRYVHGHRAGGTNPSLVEAMFFGKPIMAFDVIYNRETTQNTAYYYHDVASLRALLSAPDLDGNQGKAVAEREYVWELISRQYENLY